MNYWINTDGKQLGPLSVAEIADLDFDPANTYVWRTGMNGWKLIGEVEELANLARQKSLQPRKIEQPVDESEIPEIPRIPEIPVAPIPAEPRRPLRRQAMAEPEPAEAPTPCTWAAVAVTILCCHIFGLIALFFAYRTAKHNAEGNLREACRSHFNAELWVIISVIAGMFTVPIEIMAML